MVESIDIVGLDFDQIKTNLKNWMSGKSEFADYDFEASGINQVLNILAYKSHYMAYYANMAVNETFLDSAILRNSIVSRAKELGYFPKSYIASRTQVTIKLIPSSGTPTSILIPKGTKFSGIKDGVTYTFQTRELYNALQSNDYEIDIDVYEGRQITNSYTVNTSDVNQRFYLPNTQIDTTSLITTVQNSNADDTLRTFLPYQNILDINDKTLVYFINEADDGLYEVKFGDNVIGKALDNGNIIIFQYFKVSGSIANDISSLSLQSNIPLASVDSYTVLSKTYGGSELESDESIRYNAPLLNAAQDRGVIDTDYEALLRKEYPEFSAIKCWGGEKNVPPRYGKVFISIKQDNDYPISNYIREIIKSSIRKWNVLTVLPEIVDPNLTYININTKIKYDIDKLNISLAQLTQAVKNLCVNYSEVNLNSFSNYLRYSKLVSTIDASAPYITNNLTEITISNKFNPELEITRKYTIEFNNKIDPFTVTSTGAKYLGSGIEPDVLHYLDDDGAGKLRLYKLVSNSKSYVNTNFGTIDYDTGIIVLSSAHFLELATLQFKVTVTPTDFDIYPKRNQILLIKEEDVTVTLEQDLR